MNVHIRPATVADIPRILSLEQQSATAGHWTEEQYRQAFEPGGPERLVLVAEASLYIEARPDGDQDSGRAVVGFLVAHHLASEWELENIVVSPWPSLERLFLVKQRALPYFLKSGSPMPPREPSTKESVSSRSAAGSRTTKIPPKMQCSTAETCPKRDSHTEIAPLFWH